MGVNKRNIASELKHLSWNAVGSAANALTSLVFLMIVIRILGTNEGGVFSIAFTTAVILLNVGLYGVRNYQVTDIRNLFPSSVYISTRLITSLAMIICGVIFCIISGYSVEKTMVVCLLVFYKISEAISDVLYGILQRNNKLYIAGISMTMRAVLSVIFFIITMTLSKNLMMSCFALVAAGYAPILLIDIPSSRKLESILPVFSKDYISNLLKVCFPVFAATFLSLIVVNIPKYVIDKNLTEDIQSIYNIIVMPATSIALFSQIIIQSFLLHLARYRDNFQIKQFISMIMKIVLVIVLFTGLFELACYLWGDALLYMLYGLDLIEYISLLLLVTCGAMFSSIANVLSAALTTLRVTKVQLYLFLINLVIALVVSLYLIPKLGLYGASISYFLIMLAQFLLYSGVFISVAIKWGKNQTQES